MEVLYEKEDHIAVITLNRPDKMNAYTSEMDKSLKQILDDFRNDPKIWVGVVTGAGNKAFCAGQDIEEMYDKYKSLREKRLKLGDNLWKLSAANSLMTDETIFKPIIAAINGYCLGTGLTLALSCDIRFSSSEAVFGFPEVSLGLPTIMAALKLPAMTSLGSALEILLTGEKFDAREAYRLGIVNRIFKPEDLKQETFKMAKKMCKNAPIAMNVTKEIVLRGLKLNFLDAWRLGESLRCLVRDTDDFEEAMLSRIEKREPKYKGL